MSENWNRAYREAPEIFDAFARAEDPDRVVVRALLARAKLHGKVVLEIGCGTGRYTREFVDGTETYVALERSWPMLDVARNFVVGTADRPEFVCGAAQKLPLATSSTDVVIAAWVMVHLKEQVRESALREIDRVLRPCGEGGIWLLENHWSGEFQKLRGSRSEVEKSRTSDLVERHGFSIVDLVDTELRFPSSSEAERVLGYLCGEAVAEKVRRKRASRLGHRVIVLHRPSRA